MEQAFSADVLVPLGVGAAALVVAIVIVVVRAARARGRGVAPVEPTAEDWTGESVGAFPAPRAPEVPAREPAMAGGGAPQPITVADMVAVREADTAPLPVQSDVLLARARAHRAAAEEEARKAARAADQGGSEHATADPADPADATPDPATAATENAAEVAVEASPVEARAPRPTPTVRPQVGLVEASEAPVGDTRPRSGSESDAAPVTAPATASAAADATPAEDASAPADELPSVAQLAALGVPLAAATAHRNAVSSDQDRAATDAPSTAMAATGTGGGDPATIAEAESVDEPVDRRAAGQSSAEQSSAELDAGRQPTAASPSAEPAATALAEQAAERPTERAPADPTAARPTEPTPTDPTVERPTEATVERPTEPTVEQSTEPTVEQSTEPTIEQSTEPTAPESAVDPAGSTAEQGVATPAQAWPVVRRTPEQSGEDQTGSSQAISGAVQQALAARARQAGQVVDPRRGDARDRLLAVLLADPVRAVGATLDLQTQQEELAKLAEAMRAQREELGGVVRRLTAAGLSADQVAKLAGLGPDEVTDLLGQSQPG
ncbi:hypothetical protein [Pseudonocardia xishanensis]|uniref:Uncharacterized protein n=1 Tax=Pseudonocardia xishanensis TaxID=630995 RepID=A0ABP8RP99_9PSEU